jgi:hypothetical protein
VDNNKRLNAILDECVEKLLSGQETPEQCLARYPEYAKELEPLLRTTVLMQKAVDVKPSAEFRIRARNLMQAKMAESKAQAAATPARARRFMPRWAVAVGATALIFILGGSTVLAAAGSMPGNPLYAVKLGVEDLRVTLARSDETKVELYTAMADTRVNEMTWMASNNRTQDMPAAADRLDNYYANIGALTSTTNASFTWSATSSPDNNDAFHSIAAPAATTLAPTTANATGAGTSPEKSATGAQSSTTQVVTTQVITQNPETITNSPIFMIGANGTSGGGNQVRTGANNAASSNYGADSNLMNVLIYNSITQADKLQQLIDNPNVPESVKPALRRALAASIAGYANAVNNVSP